jgi:hypothetical protein
MSSRYARGTGAGRDRKCDDMHWLTSILKGPYGALLVGLTVLAVELVLKRLIEGPAPGQIQQMAVTGDNSPVEQHVDLSRTVVVNRIGNRVAPQRARIDSTAEPSAAEDEWGQLLLYGVLVVAAAVAATIALAKYHTLVQNIIVGVAAGTVAAALLLWRTAGRTSAVPVGSWTMVTCITAAALWYGARLLPRGAHEGVDLDALTQFVQGLSFKDAMQQFLERYGAQVALFFLSKVVGVLILVFVCLVVLVRLGGVIVAVAALRRDDPKPWHARLVDILYPTSGPVATLVWALFAVGFGLLLTSGVYWNLFS